MMQIIERENEIIRQMKETQSKGGKIYCLGAAEMGRIFKKRADLYNIKIEAFLVHRKYFKDGQSVCGIPVLCLEEMSKRNIFTSKDLLVVSLGGCNNGMINRYRNQLKICNEDGRSLNGNVDEIEENKMLDYAFLLAHREEFESLYQDLADDKSRICMDAFLNQKISGKLIYLDKVYDDGQYFDENIVDFERIKSFVDCGAFDGDTYLAFREAYRMDTGKEYMGTAYLLEPDENNYRKLMENCSHAENNNRFCQCGAWYKKDRLLFDVKGDTTSKITESGSLSIDVNSIDNIVEGQRVDFIKMDIEGSELNALKGAKKTIEIYKPTLAVCVYHKREDLITIPAYIRSLCPEYKFYIRAYRYYVNELVLYAVCG